MVTVAALLAFIIGYVVGTEHQHAVDMMLVNRFRRLAEKRKK